MVHVWFAKNNALQSALASTYISTSCCVLASKGQPLVHLAGRDAGRHVHSRKPACTSLGARAPAAALLPGCGRDCVGRQRSVIHSPGALHTAQPAALLSLFQLP